MKGRLYWSFNNGFIFHENSFMPSGFKKEEIEQMLLSSDSEMVDLGVYYANMEDKILISHFFEFMKMKKHRADFWLKNGFIKRSTRRR